MRELLNLPLRRGLQLYPLELLPTLAAELRSRDGVLIEGIRVVDADIEDQSSVRTDAGTLTTGNVILELVSPFSIAASTSPS